MILGQPEAPSRAGCEVQKAASAGIENRTGGRAERASASRASATTLPA
jgi:hypothetical protein